MCQTPAVMHMSPMCNPALIVVLCCAAGPDRDEHEHVHATEALWTLAIDTNTWQQRDPSGPLPAPSLAIGLAVFNGLAYVLANEEKMAGCMKVYELDMEAWQWRLLPCKGQAPLSLVMMVPVFVEVSVLATSKTGPRCNDVLHPSSPMQVDWDVDARLT